MGAMVGCAIDPPPVVEQTLEGRGQVPPLGVVDGKVIETGRPCGRRGSALTLPGIETDVVVIPAYREKGGLVAEAGDELETETASIEVDGPIEISHFEVDVPDMGAGRDGRLWVGHDLWFLSRAGRRSP